MCYPSTLVHGDRMRENLRPTDDAAPRLVVIDWQFVAAQPSAADLRSKISGAGDGFRAVSRPRRD
jgi:hypothetical protein